MKGKECKIIQDLLPNYIEKLTNDETNKYVKEHLNECDNCKKILENMQKGLNLNNSKSNKKEVKYMKKFNNKLKLLKAIILIILLIFIIGTARKIIIISKLSNNAENTIKTTNYHRITYTYNMGNYSKVETFSLKDKKKVVITQLTSDGTKVITMFAEKNNNSNSGEDMYLTNIYTETKDEKTVKLNKQMGISTNPQNPMHNENLLQLLVYSIPASIKTSKFNGNECYYISNFKNPNSYSSEGMYINKETGLPISTIAYEYENPDGTKGRWPTAEYIYEFDTVTEADFLEPNINEYEIQN